MTIKTKYNLGDKVMAHNRYEDDRVVAGEICSVRVDRTTLDKRYNRDMYQIEVDAEYYDGMQLFWASPEEIIKKVEEG